ncbi:hypothetical protein Taro_020879 [Colocasia esculenta]|uniref:DUF4283 domain-containing protein n=1 Tax=Colocasia esculenta TaxID=4460 RepID=A0A843UXH7_COLES|nr:hypothetical protein [Colocasia esculenta]
MMQRLHFSQDFIMSALDSKHLLIRFQNKSDYLQVLLKETLQVQGRPFRFFRWSIDFSPHEDSPIVLVWLELPGLPVNFFHECMIRSIAGSIGPVLQVDKNTSSLTRSQAARVNVQLDISKQLPARVWVRIGANGFWQPVGYTDPPVFCLSCKRFGHQQSKCRWYPPADQQPTGPAPCQSEATTHVYEEDESLRRWKEQLLGSVDLESVGGTSSLIHYLLLYVC